MNKNFQCMWKNSQQQVKLYSGKEHADGTFELHVGINWSKCIPDQKTFLGKYLLRLAQQNGTKFNKPAAFKSISNSCGSLTARHRSERKVDPATWPLSCGSWWRSKTKTQNVHGRNFIWSPCNTCSPQTDTQWYAKTPTLIHEVSLHDIKFGVWCVMTATRNTGPNSCVRP